MTNLSFVRSSGWQGPRFALSNPTIGPSSRAIGPAVFLCKVCRYKHKILYIYEVANPAAFFHYPQTLTLTLWGQSPAHCNPFPTWTSAIKGENSISVLEQVDINGSRHQFMIRGKEKIILIDDVSYLQGLTYQITNGDMFTPRNYVVKYGGTSRLIE